MTTIKYKPLEFFLITFTATWVFWLLPKLFTQELGEKVVMLSMLLGLLCPFATALYLIFVSKNKDLRDQFFNKLFNIRLIKFSSIPAIFLIPLASIVIAILISIMVGFSSDQLKIATSFSFHIGTMPTLLVLFLAASLEELGWRGYAIESLSSKFNYFNVTVIFAVLWAMWHLPLFFIENTYQSNILKLNIFYAINFMVSMIPLAFIISWLCKKNGGSISAAIFFHFIVNISQELFMVENTTKCIQTLVLIVFATIIVYTNKEMFFKKNS